MVTFWIGGGEWN